MYDINFVCHQVFHWVGNVFFVLPVLLKVSDKNDIYIKEYYSGIGCIFLKYGMRLIEAKFHSYVSLDSYSDNNHYGIINMVG